MSATEKHESSSRSLWEIMTHRFLPYWPLFLILVVLGISAAAVYLKLSNPVYESTAKLLINDEKKGSDDSKIIESLNFIGTKKIIENEIEVLKSINVTLEVVRDLHLYAPVQMPGLLHNRSAYTASPVIVVAEDPEKLVKAEDISFSYDAKKESVAVLGKHVKLNTPVELGFGRILFMVNPHYVKQEAGQFSFSIIPENVMAEMLLNKLEVTSSSKLSTVLNLKVKDENPQRGEAFLNSLIKAYNWTAIREKNAIAANTLSFVEDRLQKVSRELDSVEGNIQRYKTQKGIVDIGEQGKQFLETVGTNDLRVSEINVQLAALDAVEEYVSGINQKGSISPSTLGVKDPVLNQLLDKLYSLELERESLKKTTAPKNPMLLSITDQISKVKVGVIENINSQRRNLEAGRNNISAFNNRYSSMLKTIPKKEHELLEISRQQSIKNSIYSFLLQKREETALSNATVAADNRLVEMPHSSVDPVSPNKYLVAGLGMLLSLMAGIAFVLIKEFTTNKILFRKEIEERTSVPIIGEINYEKSASKWVFTNEERNFIGEQFRQLRTALGYIGVGNRRKKILFTSSVSGDGKSFISANLAICLAMSGKKVVLLEMDLRQPQLSSFFNISSDVGLTNFFRQEVTEDKIIQEAPGVPNLFIVSAGPGCPNPSELILTGRLNELMNFLESRFDLVLIDAPPVGPVSDAYVIGQYCDATLYIIRHNHTPRSYVEKLDHENRIHSLKNMAIIFNGVQSRGLGKYGPRYGYGYSDVKGYGEFRKKIRRKMLTEKAI